MPQIVIIAAVADNGVIGVANSLPWRLPEDLKHFKALTTGHAVIMGRKTWESLPHPLPDRHNIVVTRHPDYAAPGATVTHSFEKALALCSPDQTAFVIGGGELYAQALTMAARMELTEVHLDVEGDTHFPRWRRDDWIETARQPGMSIDGLRYDFVSYKRHSTG